MGSSMDMAYLEPHVKKWKHWKWNYNSLTSQQYQKLKKIRDAKLRMYQAWDALPYWFPDQNGRKINVIFIRSMDEFLAGEQATIEIGLYRNWLQPNKIALPATNANIQRWQHLNLDERTERERRQKMEQLSNEISQIRLEMKMRRDPETESVYTYITKQRICRKLLLLKRITVSPEQVVIKRLGVSIMNVESGDADDGSLDFIKDAGSYTIEVVLDSDYKFEFRLNGRYSDIAKSNPTPFAFDDEEDGDMDDDDDDDDTKAKKKKSKELKADLKKWQRRKHANQLLDDLVGIRRKSRYSELYNVSKTDLTEKPKQVQIET